MIKIGAEKCEREVKRRQSFKTSDETTYRQSATFRQFSNGSLDPKILVIRVGRTGEGRSRFRIAVRIELGNYALYILGNWI